MTISTLLSQAKHQLSHLEETSLIAEAILTHTLNRPSTYLWSHPEEKVSNDQEQAYLNLLQRAADHEPLAYLLGYKEFYGRRFTVTSDTLIPRPESEQLIQLTLNHLNHRKSRTTPPDSLTIVDVGTGSGALAITLALEIPHAHLYAIDISASALKVAKQNAANLKAADITFLHGSLLEPLQGIIPPDTIDIIIANLPYISDSEYINLPKNVRDFEPKQALLSGPTPDKLNHQLVKQSKGMLKEGGLLAYETTNGQIIIPAIKSNN